MIDCNVTISYVQHFKWSDNVTGHLTYPGFEPKEFKAPVDTKVFRSADKEGKRWSMPLGSFLASLGRVLKPTVIVYNTGLHDSNPLRVTSNGALEAASSQLLALRRAAPCIVWRTTTRQAPSTPGEKPKPARLTGGLAAAFADGPVLDAARFTDSLAHLPAHLQERLYADQSHFSPQSMVYHDLNIALLSGLYAGNAFSPEMWEARFGPAGPYMRVALMRWPCTSD